MAKSKAKLKVLPSEEVVGVGQLYVEMVHNSWDWEAYIQMEDGKLMLARSPDLQKIYDLAQESYS